VKFHPEKSAIKHIAFESKLNKWYLGQTAYLIMKLKKWFKHCNHLPMVGCSDMVGAGLVEVSGLRSECQAENKRFSEIVSVLSLAE